jgi:predicted nucleic acid-binding protein
VWAAPLLWRSELRNVLAGYLRKNQLTVSDAGKIMDAAISLMGGREYVVPSRAVLQLTAVSMCSGYACEFVALAADLKVPLVTADQEILGQFPKIAILLDSF